MFNRFHFINDHLRFPPEGFIQILFKCLVDSSSMKKVVYTGQINKKFYLFFLSLLFVRFQSENKKNVSKRSRDLRFGTDVNNKTLRENCFMIVKMFNMFGLVRRYFRSSQKELQNFIFLHSRCCLTLK